MTITATGPITLTDAYGRKRTATPAGGVVTLPVGTSPVFATGPITGVSD